MRNHVDPETGRKIPAWLVVGTAAVGVVVGLVLLVIGVKALRGNEHWRLSAEDRGSETVVLVYRSRPPQPTYTVHVPGYHIPSKVSRVVIDDDGPPVLPLGIRRKFVDTTILPGRCTLEMGPVTLDVMEARMMVNGQVCEPGGTITLPLTPAR